MEESVWKDTISSSQSGRTSGTRTGNVIGSKHGHITSNMMGNTFFAIAHKPLAERDDERWASVRKKNEQRRSGCNHERHQRGTTHNMPVKVPPQRKQPPPVNHVNLIPGALQELVFARDLGHFDNLVLFTKLLGTALRMGSLLHSFL